MGRHYAGGITGSGASIEGGQFRLDSIYLIIIGHVRGTPKLGVARINGRYSRAAQVFRREISCGRRRPLREAPAGRIGVTGEKERFIPSLNFLD